MGFLDDQSQQSSCHWLVRQPITASHSMPIDDIQQKLSVPPPPAFSADRWH